MKLKNGKVHYAHNGVFTSLVGSYPKLILDFRLYKESRDSSKKDEGELTVVKRLLKKVRAIYTGTVDVVVYGALMCNSVWINQCIDNKMTPVIHVKENNIWSIKYL